MRSDRPRACTCADCQRRAPLPTLSQAAFTVLILLPALWLLAGGFLALGA